MHAAVAEAAVAGPFSEASSFLWWLRCCFLDLAQRRLFKAASRQMQNLKSIRNTAANFVRAIAASCVQSQPYFASTRPEQLFELKNEDAIKNLRVYATHVLSKCYPTTLCMAQSNLIRWYL
jgi:hypothetical protein